MIIAKLKLDSIYSQALLWLTHYVIPYVLYINTFVKVLIVELACLSIRSLVSSRLYRTTASIADTLFWAVRELNAFALSLANHIILQCIHSFRALPNWLVQKCARVQSYTVAACQKLYIALHEYVTGTKKMEKKARNMFSVVLAEATVVVRMRIAYQSAGKDAATRARLNIVRVEMVRKAASYAQEMISCRFENETRRCKFANIAIEAARLASTRQNRITSSRSPLVGKVRCFIVHSFALFGIMSVCKVAQLLRKK